MPPDTCVKGVTGVRAVEAPDSKTEWAASVGMVGIGYAYSVGSLMFAGISSIDFAVVSDQLLY
jgi:hypothetical protein